MKYLVIISVAGFGSTGRLAAQTCRELMEQGNTCVLAFGREESSCADVPTVRIGSPWDCRIHALKSRFWMTRASGPGQPPGGFWPGCGNIPGCDLAAQPPRLLPAHRGIVSYLRTVERKSAGPFTTAGALPATAPI